MAAPRVFISSTYYDLKHVRNDIGDFIRSLGYTPVMHDRGGVAYTQTDTIENSCYSELTTCNLYYWKSFWDSGFHRRFFNHHGGTSHSYQE